ncbi:c-type cytochrome [Methylicorpusculum oleiharenae]|uniref:c-type cytochrome n=1 Tax=Methylicorpusculum oleiharenae TaxID=1338687 RepID=UPI0013580B05|nr:c-type cytochrome [Methylicorpusculum oleiharenae]MCD2451244.1 c-type cytochrome [Methylicorpusculum oleiharenae]
MKKSVFLATLTLTASAAVFSGAVSANEVFDKNCASCHKGGGNIMNPAKTLMKDSLDKNGVATVDAVKAIVTNGKAPMPAFKASLDEKQIESVSAYVIEQAGKGWK